MPAKNTTGTFPVTLYSGVTPTAPTNTATGTIYASYGATGIAVAPTHVANGACTVTLSSNETNTNYATLRFVATGVDIRHVDLVFESNWTPARAIYLDKFDNMIEEVP